MYLARAGSRSTSQASRSETASAERVCRPGRPARPGEWISGRGWDQNRWPGAGFPTRASLDRVAPATPLP